MSLTQGDVLDGKYVIERMLGNNYALAALVHQADGEVEHFEAAAAQLLTANSQLLAVSLSPGGVVRHVAPLHGNENLLGFDQLNDPAQRREAISATGLIAGVSLGGILGALAMASSPNILSKDEVEGLIANHNTTLMRRLRDGAMRPKITPSVAWKGGGVALSFQF